MDEREEGVGKVVLVKEGGGKQWPAYLDPTYKSECADEQRIVYFGTYHVGVIKVTAKNKFSAVTDEWLNNIRKRRQSTALRRALAEVGNFSTNGVLPLDLVAALATGKQHALASPRKKKKKQQLKQQQQRSSTPPPARRPAAGHARARASSRLRSASAQRRSRRLAAGAPLSPEAGGGSGAEGEAEGGEGESGGGGGRGGAASAGSLSSSSSSASVSSSALEALSQRLLTQPQTQDSDFDDAPQGARRRGRRGRSKAELTRKRRVSEILGGEENRLHDVFDSDSSGSGSSSGATGLRLALASSQASGQEASEPLRLSTRPVMDAAAAAAFVAAHERKLNAVLSGSVATARRTEFDKGVHVRRAMEGRARYRGDFGDFGDAEFAVVVDAVTARFEDRCTHNAMYRVVLPHYAIKLAMQEHYGVAGAAVDELLLAKWTRDAAAAAHTAAGTPISARKRRPAAAPAPPPSKRSKRRK